MSMMECYLTDSLFLNSKEVEDNHWCVMLSNGKSFDVWKDIEYNGNVWNWKIDTQYFDEKYALGYLKTLVAEKLTGYRIIYHSKFSVPDICGIDGAACRSKGKCNTALCSHCPVAEQFEADRDGVKLIYAVNKE